MGRSAVSTARFGTKLDSDGHGHRSRNPGVEAHRFTGRDMRSSLPRHAVAAWSGMPAAGPLRIRQIARRAD